MIGGWLLAVLAASASPVSGRVLQKGDAAPLSEAELVLPDGTVVAVDDDARFTVDLPDGIEATVTIRSLDHVGVDLVLTPPLDEPVKVFLAPADVPGEIVVEAFRPTSDLTRHVVDAEMAYETPGTYDDAVRLVQALPGVNIQREYAPNSGDVSIRGSLPGDNRYYLDGIEVPYLYHFNQYASVFPASQLDELELFSSTFGVRYGDAVGAVIEARSDTERPDDVTGHVGLNFVTVGADVKVPLPRDWWVGASARRSFHDIAGESNDQFGLWPRFYDFNVRAEQGSGAVGHGVFAAGAGDRYDRAVGELDLADPLEATQTPELGYGRDYQLLGYRHRWRGGRVVTALLHDHLRADLTAPGGQDMRTLSLPSRVDTSGDVIEGRLQYEAGGELRPEVMWLDLSDGGRFGPLVSREAPAIAWGADVDERALRLRADAYGELHALLGPVRLVPGVRVGVDSMGWVPKVEPRLAARFRVAEQTELRVAGGRYQQRPETEQLVALRELPTTDGWQVGLGLDQTIGGRLEIAAEGYVKGLSNVLFQPIDGPPEVYARGESWGAELTVRYRMRETLFLWGWFAYGRSFVRPEAGGRRIPTIADQPFSGGLVASWNILPQLNVAVRYRIASGLPYTGIDGSTYDGTRDTWIPRYQSPNTQRFPLYQKIDLHTAYTFVFDRWSLAISADLWIVPPSAAQLYPTWNYDYSETGFVQGPPVLPLLGLRASY